MPKAILARQLAIEAGLKQYHTGKPCKNGHIANRNVNDHCCIVCKAIRTEEWRKKNLDRMAMHERNRRKKPEVKAERAAYRDANRERIREIKRESYARNREAVLKKQKETYYNNLERFAGYSVTRRKRNPEVIKIRNIKRRAMQNGAAGEFDKKDIRAIFMAQEGRCKSCDKALRDDRHIDHVMPLILGGTNWPGNIQLLCPPCNLKKRAEHPMKWAAECENGRWIGTL